MITVGLDRQKYRSHAKRLEKLFAGKMSRLKAEVERKSKIVARDAAFALLYNTMPSESSGIGKAIANIKRDFKTGLLTESEAFTIIEKESTRRVAMAFYAAFKQGNYSKAKAILQNAQVSISGYEVGGANQINTMIIDTFKSRIIAKVDLEELMKKKIVPRLGFTASGWAACMERLGFDGNVIRWKGTNLHGHEGGQVWVTHEKHKVTIWMANTRPLARKLINPSRVKSIMDGRREQLRNWLAKP